MTQAQSHYRNFDVMNSFDAWDPHTQSVVSARLQGASKQALLTPPEVNTLRSVLGHLLYENRAEVIDFVVAHFEKRLTSQVGEAQREQNVPPEANLVRQGLAAFDAQANLRHGKRFAECDIQQQFGIVAGLQHGHWEVAQLPDLVLLPQKILFKKLLGLAVEAYASHPTIWSEMGYAGPAYPRGYYRLELGVTDPWEPRQDDTDGDGPTAKGDGDV